MSKSTTHPAIYYRDLLNSSMTAIRKSLSELKEELPLRADKLTREYFTFRKDKSDLLNTPNNQLIFLPVIVLAIIGLYVIDQAVLSDVYDFTSGIGGQELPDEYRITMKLVFPLVVIALYMVGIEAHSNISNKYNEKKRKFAEGQNPLLYVPSKSPSIPAVMYVTGLLKYCFPLFIVLIAAATFIMVGNPASALLSSSLYWIALFSHLMLIFFGEAALRTVKVAWAKVKKKRFWKKRFDMEKEKIELITKVSNDTENWYDTRSNAMSQIESNLHHFFRIRFRPDELSTLNRITSINFVGAVPDYDKSLFPDWKEEEQKKPSKSIKDISLNGKSSLDKLIVPNEETYTHENNGSKVNGFAQHQPNGQSNGVSSANEEFDENPFFDSNDTVTL